MRIQVFAATLLLALPAAAADLPAPEAGATTLHLSEAAERAVKRDRLRAELRVELVDADARRVQAGINKAMGEAVERAKATPGVEVETSGYSVYEERPSNGPSRWHGSQGLTLGGGDFASILSVAGDLQGRGLVMAGLSFELSPASARAVEDELTTIALARLRQRAERVASDLQMTVVRLRDVAVGNAAADQPRPRVVGMATAQTSAAPPPAAEPGDALVRVSVEATVVLEPGEHNAP